MRIRANGIIAMVVLYLVLTLSAPVALAFESENKIKATTWVGFNSTCKAGSWVPVTILVENRGVFINAARVEVGIRQGNEYKNNIYSNQYARIVDLPEGAHELIRFTVFVESDLHPLEISIIQDGNFLYQEVIRLRDTMVTKPILLIAGHYPAQTVLPFIPEFYAQASALPEYLPDQWYGYDSVSKLILSARVLSRLSQRQYQALKTWLKAGGMLITTGDMNTQALAQNRVKELFGIKSARNVKMEGLSGLWSFAGKTAKFSGELWVNHLQMEGGKILAETDGVPLLISKRMGDGRLLFVSFDILQPDFIRWGGRASFWAKTLSSERSSPVTDSFKADDIMLDFLFNHSFALFPKFTIAGPFLLLYCCLLMYCLTPGKKDDEIRHLKLKACFFAVTTGFSIIVGGWFFYARPDMEHTITIHQVKGNSAIYKKHLYKGVYSAYAQGKKVQVAKDAMVRVLFPESQDKKSWRIGTILNKMDRRVVAFDLDRYETGHFKIIEVADSGFHYKAGLSPGKETILEIGNYTDFSIDQTIAVFNSKIYKLGRFESDTVKMVTLDHPFIELDTHMSSDDKELLIRYMAKGVRERKKGLMVEELVTGVIEQFKSDREKIKNNINLIGWYPADKKVQNLPENGSLLIWELEYPVQGQDRIRLQAGIQ